MNRSPLIIPLHSYSYIIIFLRKEVNKWQKRRNPEYKNCIQDFFFYSFIATKFRKLTLNNIQRNYLLSTGFLKSPSIIAPTIEPINKATIYINACPTTGNTKIPP